MSAPVTRDSHRVHAARRAAFAVCVPLPFFAAGHTRLPMPA